MRPGATSNCSLVVYIYITVVISITSVEQVVVTMAEHSIVEFSMDHSGHSCGYCHSSSSSYSHGLCWVPVSCSSISSMHVSLFLASLIASDNIIFRPNRPGTRKIWAIVIPRSAPLLLLK